ncbi:MAG TPA: ABC transporter permease [Candidatus Polarisedimenticolaceae bacterium]|nr:ABC transporter permease [Candidatus Polarisedimenticolaceae bacterium]
MSRDVSVLRTGALLCAIVAVAAIGAPWLPLDPNRLDLGSVLEAPSLAHWMGTDGLGRDVLSRLVHGARVSLGVGVGTAAIALLIGLPLGALAGYRGGWWDAVVSRAIEAVLCFPALLLALALLSVAPHWLTGLPETARLALALGLVAWTPTARYLRAEFRRLRSSEAVLAARAAGAGGWRIALRHLLPQGIAPVLVTLAFGAAAASLAEASLSFIGIGVAPPTSSWGQMLFEAARHMGRAWWLALFPGAALFVTVYGFNRLAEGLRDWLDPRPVLR